VTLSDKLHPRFLGKIGGMPEIFPVSEWK